MLKLVGNYLHKNPLINVEVSWQLHHKNPLNYVKVSRPLPNNNPLNYVEVSRQLSQLKSTNLCLSKSETFPIKIP